MGNGNAEKLVTPGRRWRACRPLRVTVLEKEPAWKLSTHGRKTSCWPHVGDDDLDRMKQCALKLARSRASSVKNIGHVGELELACTG